MTSHSTRWRKFRFEQERRGLSPTLLVKVASITDGKLDGESERISKTIPG
jgi:hypothetical protein